MNYDYLFKLLLIGDQAVGKTSFCNRLNGKPYEIYYDQTIGIEFSTCFAKVSDILIKCQLWDTSGKKEYLPLTKTYYKGVAGVIILYNVANRKSFDKVEFWLNEIKKYKSYNENINIFLVGTKNDLFNDIEVSYEEGLKKAQKHKISFYETSSKLGENINKIKNDICSKIYSNYNSNVGHSGIKKPPYMELKTLNEDSSFYYDCCCCS
jgi:small GTP-binding protein